MEFTLISEKIYLTVENGPITWGLKLYKNNIDSLRSKVGGSLHPRDNLKQAN